MLPDHDIGASKTPGPKPFGSVSQNAQTPEDKLVRDFLYWNPPHGGMPDGTIRIGVEFEVGGAYEDWGWIVERLTYVKDSRPYAYTKKTLGTGRNIKNAIESATKTILKELEASDQEKCWCGKAMYIYKVEGDKRIPLCLEHNSFTNPGLSAGQETSSNADSPDNNKDTMSRGSE